LLISKAEEAMKRKKAKKLGYDCLEKYFEDKLANEAQLLAENEVKEEELLAEKKALKNGPADKKTCGCC
jgi:serine/threonine protein kinase HipA of HipAB toxin-antitoxin module